MLRNLSFALRQLRKSPGFALTAVLTLALGIGAVTTVAAWTDAVLYNPWPHVRAPRDLRFISATVLGSNGYSVHYGQYRFVRDANHSFSGAAAFAQTTANLNTASGRPEAVNAGLVSSNYFQILGLKPQAAQFFRADADDRAYGSDDEVVLSDSLWRERFDANPAIVGRVVSINRHTFTVVGVAPAEFAGIFGGIAESAWLPLSSLRDLLPDAAADPLAHYGLQVVVRLRPGVRGATAAAELHTLAKTFAREQHTGNYKGWDLNLDDAAHFQRGFFVIVGEQLPILAGASALLMLLVCINIASLLAQRGARRRREVAIRIALGATTARIAAQVLAEMGVLAVLGALAGWAASTAMSRGLYLLLPSFGMPLVFNLQPDSRILLFVTAITVAVTLVCGMYPVRQALRVSQKEALHEGGAAVAGAPRRRFGRSIVLGLQLGICFIILVCCGLLMRTALNVVGRNVGFNRAHCLTATLDLERSGYDAKRAMAFESALLERMQNAPGVTGATLTTHLPMGDWGSGNTQGFSIPGYVPAKGEEMDVVTDFDGPNFFHVMGIALRQGRDFTTQDNANAPGVAIVNETMAKRYWPKGDAVGSTIVANKQPHRIVGIVHDYAYHDPANTEPDPVLYLPLAQGVPGYGYVIVAVRSRTTAAAMREPLSQAVAELDGSLPLEQVRSLQSVSGELYQLERIPAELLGVYALCSVLVAMLGLYAVIAYSVTERQREFALRMALGSTRSGVFGLVLRSSAGIALIGIATGVAGCAGAVRLLHSMLFGVASSDPLTYVAAAALLLLTVFVAGLLPARRAARIEPMQALRTE
ncbi:MAG TPA: ABC transporter permease [Terracidiphilus sp.]|nr:ABC transporter permease [Terracidiphilus sp.]